MAGSFGALGADISALQINPAGMGRFSTSKTSISFNNSILTNSATYNGTVVNSSENKFSLAAAGVVFTTDLSTSNDGRKYGQLTLGYTRLKNFANRKRYEGENFYSLLDVFANSGYGIDPAYIFELRPFTTGLAYDVFALNYDPSGEQYYSLLTLGDMYHEREIITDGGIGEFHIGYSENYMDVLYYGASIGVRRVNYEESYSHHEELLDTVGTSLMSFNYLYDQSTEGTGFNLKLGLIYLPTDQYRIGLSFESPTVFTLEDKWTADMTALHDDGLKYVEPEYVPEGTFQYRLKTPMKIRTSFAYILGMRGAINLDLELSRLVAGKLRPANSNEYNASQYDFKYENDAVREQYRTIVNTRLGIEYMIFSGFFVRGGIAILPQPYKNKDISSITRPNMTYAAGIGWENRLLSLNLGYRLLEMNSEYYAFDPSKVENRTVFNTNAHNLVFTASFKF
ncbi:hypothetical protein CW751_07670 [Brumimicrobium salinarum]|uniref:Aromatic hydrocarbon degradation protein n=2 Tax=Brumimicrobium salinarum TaxID=2058658 RepID=A0A2I0R362_9FLAO|nr:hypothetical protein CW751_07670 [Brumimicrobium salinarum]